MPASHPELVPTEERLRRFLLEAFPIPQASVSSAANAPHPLLLLRFRHDLAGFALADGDPRQCFEQSYSYFKKLYADRHREWDDLNLIFVLCLGHRDRELEAFCASVETDVFFCRKFTVALDAPWETELARLPFFPLERRRSASIRPSSAQTLLKASGVPAALAASIVGRVSEESIVQSCLGGRFGTPTVVDSGLQTAQYATGDAIQAIRVQLVEIENFRAYRRALSFDIDADLVVLYGPNGFGKTSFFDAIDFVATGDIGRLGLATKEERFVKAAKHLDAASQASSVTLTIRDEDGLHRVHRTVEQRRQPRVDDTPVERKEALLRLTNPYRSVGTDHVEHLVRLFRATHLFSQEFQELTEEFRQHCRLSSEVVSRMLTFEDYVNARRKVARVLELIRGRMVVRDRRRRELTDEVAQDRAEVGGLQEAARSAESPQAVATLRESVRDNLRAAGVEPVADSDPVAEARGWRALLEARISDARAKATRLSEFAAQAPLIAAQRAQVSTQQVERRRKTAKFDETNVQLRQAREGVARSETQLAALIQREESLRERGRALGWQRQTKPAYDTLTARSSALAAEIGALTKVLADQNVTLERLTTEIGAAEAQLARTTRSLEENRGRLARLTDLVARFPRWQQCALRRQAVHQTVSQGNTLLAGIRRELQAATNDLNNATFEERQAAAELAQIERTQTELQNLLAALEAHVSSANCPACGLPHESKNHLLRRLRERRSATAASGEVTSRLQQIRERVSALTTRVEELTRRRQNADNAASAGAAELQELAAEIAEFESRAREIDIDLSDMQLHARLEEHLTIGERTNTDLGQVVGRQQQTVDAARGRLAAARAEAESRQREIAAKRQALKEADAQLERIRRDAARIHVSLDTDLHQLGEDQNTTQRDTDRVVAEIAEKREEVTTRQTSLAELDRRTQTLKQELEADATTLSSLERAIGEYGRDREALGLDSEAERTDITEIAEQGTRRASQFEQLKQSAVDLEMALDAAARSAASERLAAKIRTAEGELGAFGEQQAQDGAWAAYFDRLQQKLEQTQDRAVAGYTEEYGPLTSIIQRRLRPVSGFEDISLHPEGDRIEVRVSRKGEQLPPTDFFSQSQQQILILSLFITACITQTWSAFAPILLDDPVTHFDDLNAYSFLDLIGGLLETEPEARQFILSTCDERLFLLARQRFQHLGDRAKVYRFISCSSDGPVVERV